MSATIDRSTWKRVRLGEALTNVGWCNYSHLQPRQVRKVTQGDDTGEVSITTDYYHPASPVVLFGDHTCNVKYVDFDCLILGDGVKLLTPNHEVFSTRFLYYLVQYVASKLPQGYARHLAVLKETECVLPCYEDQFKIANAITSIDTHISALQALIAKYEAIKKETVNLLLKPKAGWERVKLGDVAVTSSGGTPNRSNEGYYQGTIPWFTTSELHDEVLYDSKEHISEEALQKTTAKVFPAGTLLLAMYGATIGKLGVLAKPAATNQACCAIKCGSNVETAFLFQVLINRRQELVALGCGAGQPNISQQIVQNLSLVLPPLSEQRKIAEQISAIDKVLADYKAQLEEARQLKAGMMSYFFG